jgi:hypothetical protein
MQAQFDFQENKSYISRQAINQKSWNQAASNRE